MLFYSTNDTNNRTEFRSAVMNGLSEDGGLYVPAKIPRVDKNFLENINKWSFEEIANYIAKMFTDKEIDNSVLSEIIHSAFNFPVPLISLDRSHYVLELFHGPTLAFKDFGARFMARIMEYFIKDSSKKLNLLVATSGDTGSAVANGFLDIEDINVLILYPSKKVSLIQEKQFTTLANNIIALEIEGTFDDCQRLVKSAFVDNDIRSKLYISSANSINIARLLPQTFYYFEAYKQIKDKNKDIIFSIPSGNLGNLCAGVISVQMGLPIKKLIGSNNQNRVFFNYIRTGNFVPKNSIKTLSNAMDVGNPSNFHRIVSIYSNNFDMVRKDILSASYDDEMTLKGMREVYNKYNYIIDPHGSVGYLALRDYLDNKNSINESGIIIETAHPAKFRQTVESALNIQIKIPDRLQACLNKQKKTTILSNNYQDFKDYLLSGIIN
ncbi:threonine synthase [Bacteroidota bacterium]